MGSEWQDGRLTKAIMARLLVTSGKQRNTVIELNLGVNRIGRDPHVAYAGGSIIAGPRGDILAEAGAGPMVLAADLDLHAVAAWRAEFPALRDIHRELLGSIQIDASIGQQSARCESS